MTLSFDYLVYIGRFQPFHKGHQEILRRALEKSAKVIVVLGSAHRARNIKNPFSDDERRQMILTAMEDAMPGAGGRIIFCPLRDYYNDDKWVPAVREAVAKAAPSSTRIGIIGHDKDDSSYYLHKFPDWQWVSEENYHGLSATDLRRFWFSASDEEAWKRLAVATPASVLSFLKEFRESPAYADLAGEFSAVEEGKAAWSSAPYPPVFVTVDAVVRCKGHVLMVKRGGLPGRGQWALPGGFVEQNERLREASIRELAEETGLGVSADVLRASLVDRDVFDHPDRSVRGRTITHGFFFDVAADELPAVVGADDAVEARWVLIDELVGMETAIFDDHLHIVNRFLKVLA
ncbi:MAG TPA: bifunctional nicotinamide-nucleotide adenylyltransferase/Nudix hydroxylase [Burkholderiales bacterium]|nr:bifunctional nicotinamide-nucleotide adenylyltransferase/Nudix hydroxylase [Burkholderiales bacterium]